MTELSDFHIHPNYSIDGTGTIRQYCDQALEAGIGKICFTTHYDVNPRRLDRDAFWRKDGQRVRVTDEIIAGYFDEIERAREYFAPFGLHIYRGLEIDYYDGVEREAERLRGIFQFDFVIGSVHCLDDVAISEKNEAPSYFSRKTLSEMADDYTDLLVKAAQVSGFDCLAHLDYYVRYGREYYGDAIDHIELERFDKVFAALIEHDKGIEINTSPFRYGAKTFHPKPEIIERAIRSGVKIISVGSDSHKPSQLGGGIKEAYALLDKYGIAPEILSKIQTSMKFQ
jgi:histidinol-phosphatase (PHP family)